MRNGRILIEKLRIFIYSCIAFFSCTFASCEEYAHDLKYDIITPVWGRDFTDCFLKVSLPLLLCPGNIGAFPPNSARYRIFTTKNDWEYMQSHPSMKRLQEMIFVDFVEITPPPSSQHPHYKMVECQNQAIQEAGQDKRALIYMGPDILLSNNAFRTIVKYAMEGCRLILVSSLDVKKEIVIPLLESIYLAESLYHSRNIYDYGLNSRQLVKLVLPYIHPLSESFIHKNKEINAVPSYVIWELDTENLLSFGFSCHPIFILPEIYATTNEVYDFGFPSLACPSMNQWKVITDSDEMVHFHYPNYKYIRTLQTQMMPFNSFNIANFWRIHGKPHYWFSSEYLVYTHSSDYKPEWNHIEEEAKAFMKEVNSRR